MSLTLTVTLHFYNKINEPTHDHQIMHFQHEKAQASLFIRTDSPEPSLFVLADEVCSQVGHLIRTAPPNSAKFRGVRPRMYIEDLL